MVLIAVPFFESCGSPQKRVPSMDVFGSYFPAWLISLAAGIVLTVIAGGVGRLIDIRPSGFLGFPPERQPDTDFQHLCLVLVLREVNT